MTHRQWFDSFVQATSMFRRINQNNSWHYILFIYLEWYFTICNKLVLFMQQQFRPQQDVHALPNKFTKLALKGWICTRLSNIMCVIPAHPFSKRDTLHILKQSFTKPTIVCTLQKMFRFHVCMCHFKIIVVALNMSLY